MSEPPIDIYPPPAPAGGPNRLLVLLVVVFGSFVLVAGLGLALLLYLSPAVRARLPLFAQVTTGQAPPEAPNKYANPDRSGPLLIEDDFARAQGLWEQSQTLVVDGSYELRLDQPDYDTYGLYLGAAAVRNFDMAVDVQQVAGDPIAEYGIRFRQAGPGDHLMFSISGNGYFRLLRVSDEQYISAVPWTRHEAIATNTGAVNRLRVIARDDSITAFINEQQVLEYRDTVQAAGQLTLGLVTFAQGGLAVRFDNIAGEAEDTSGDQVAPIDLAEDFSDPATIPWSIGGAEITGGAYEIFVGGAVQSWQQPLPTGSSRVDGNFILEVEATLLSGTEGNTAYGVMFSDGGEFDFFTLYLYPEGAIGLFRSEANGAGGAIVQPVLIEAINPGFNATNKIRIEARDAILSVSINGQALGDLEFQDGVNFAGMVGLIVNSGDLDGVRARFDNFRLEELP